MAKKVYKIEAFEGGINQKYDPRDIKDNQLEEAFNVDVSNPGRITMAGAGDAPYVTKSAKGNAVNPSDDGDLLSNGMNLTRGYGLFSFSHDYNMASTPNEVEVDFLCINDGADIHIWDSCYNPTPTGQNDAWISKAITLGKAHASGAGDEFVEKVKPVYYKADNGLRVCDGQFCEKDTGVLTNDGTFSATDTSFTSDSITLAADEYIKIDNEIMQVVSAVSSGTTVTVKRGQFGTLPSSHSDDSKIYTINVPKVLSHINRPFLEKARTYSSATAYTYGTAETINKWKEDAQSLEPPNDYGTYGLSVYDGEVSAMAQYGVTGDDDAQLLVEPDQKEKVHFGVWESHSEDDQTIQVESVEDGDVVNGNNCLTLVGPSGTNLAEKGYTVGKIVIITGSTNYDGIAEIVAMGTAANKITVGIGYVAADTGFEMRLEENRIDENLQNKYIFGMSFLYDGGGSEMQESPIKPGYLYSGLIDHDKSIGKAGGDANDVGWLTSLDLVTINTALPTANDDHWRYFDNYFWYNDDVCDSNYFLVYRMSDNQAAGNYKISIDVTISNDATLIIHPPFFNKTSTPASGGTIGDGDGDGTSVTINATGTYFFHAKGCDANTPSFKDIFVAEAVDGDGDDDIRINSVQVYKETPVEMDANNAIDMRGWEGIPKIFSSFNMSKNSTYNWNERIAGYRIYMKQVDSASFTLSDEWLLLNTVDFAKGTYINHGNDNVEQDLSTSNSYDRSTGGNTFYKSLVTTSKYPGDTRGIINGDTLRNIPLDTYESENGYKAETNTAAMYKTATVVDRKVFIGNLKIGEKTYPDRMIEAPTDRFDTFPDAGLHYIDVAVGDGDEIVKLESVGNRLIQFKKKHAYVIEVSSEGVDLLHTWPHKGIKSPSQVIAAGDGVVWANDNGLYYYDGNELKTITGETFQSGTWVINEQAFKPPILGYDEASNKVLVLTSNVTGKDHGGYIYDIQNGSLTECQNLFSTYPVTAENTMIDFNGDGNYDILDIIAMGNAFRTGEEGTLLDEYDMTSILPAYMLTQNIPIVPDEIYRSNMVTTKDRHLVMATNTSSAPLRAGFSVWTNEPRPLYNFNSSADHFNVQTKDIDFGNIARRKKIYSIYVSFKAQSYTSGVIVKYATNGSNTFSGTFKDTTYYSNTKGFDAYNAGTSSNDWITVQLKPTTSINNIYSFQLQFSFADAGTVSNLNADSNKTDTTITLATTASGTNDAYNGMPIYLYHGGSHYYGKITDYAVTSTKVATITPALSANVDTATAYDIGFIPKQFEINDIAIVYREKSIK